MKRIKQYFALLWFYLLPICLLAQDDECYTKWEQDFFSKINIVRNQKGLQEFKYSSLLTKAAVLKAHGTHPNSFAKASVGYMGSSIPMTYKFSFEHTTPQEATDALVTFYDEYLNSISYKAMGIARINNITVVFLGSIDETVVAMPLCEEVASSKPYAWLCEPGANFWDMARIHIGNYVAVRNINQWGIINANGNMVLPFQYWTMSPYKIAGQFIVTKTKNDKQEYIIDTTGKIIETFEHDGYIIIGKNRIAYQGNVNFIVDENGKQISEQYGDIYSIGKNKLAFLAANKLYGIMNNDGKILIPPKYGEIMGYSENFAAVKVGTKWGFIDTSFNMVIQPIATAKQDFYFSNGLVPVSINGKIGYMNTQGKIAITPKYSAVEPFGENGLAPVYLNGKCGVINKKGETIVPFMYDAGLPFENGYGAVRKNLLYAILNSDGKLVTDFEFDYLYFLPDHIKAKIQGRWGIMQMK